MFKRKYLFFLSSLVARNSPFKNNDMYCETDEVLCNASINQIKLKKIKESIYNTF